MAVRSTRAIRSSCRGCGSSVGELLRRGHQGEYLDANPLERAPDGEVKARWRDEGEWQVMWIEK